MNFAGASKKHFALTQVHDSAAEPFFALSVDNKTDAGLIMNMLGKGKVGAMAADEDSAIGDIMNTQDFCMTGLSNRV